MRKIYSVTELLHAANDRKSVYCPSTNPQVHRFDVTPAAFVSNMTARSVQGLIDYGMYVYEPPAKSRYKKKEGA